MISLNKTKSFRAKNRRRGLHHRTKHPSDDP
jgi:hypothetical protein